MSQVASKAVEIAARYMGDRGEGFIRRQCSAHLNINMDSLSPKHIPELARWVAVSAGLIMDKAQVERFKKEILSLREEAVSDKDAWETLFTRR